MPISVEAPPPTSALGKPCLVHQKARGPRVWPLPVDEHIADGAVPHTFLDPGGGPFKYKMLLK